MDDTFDIFGEEPEKFSGACGECPRHGSCNDMLKDTYACKEIKRKEKKNGRNEGKS